MHQNWRRLPHNRHRRLSLGKLVLDCSITFPIESPDCILSFATAEPFKLSALTSLPGGGALGKLGLQSLDQIEVELNDLTFTVDLKSPLKLQSINLDVSTNGFTWELLRDLLSISDPRLLLELTRLDGDWQVDAVLSGSLALYLLEETEESDGEVLADFVYRSDHAAFLRRRREWFEKMDLYLVLWWVPRGHRPTPEEGIARLDLLRSRGPSADAFTFGKMFPQPGSQETGVGSLDTPCPA